MVVESWAILVLIVLIAYAYFRARKLNFAVSVLPLGILPFVNLLSRPLCRLLQKQFSLDPGTVKTAMIVIGVILACLLYGVFASTLKKRSIKLTYLCVSSVFTLILALIFLFY